MYFIKKIIGGFVKDVIKQGFSSDKNLIDKWHIISGSGLDSCVNKTIEDLKTQTFSDFKFFVVLNDEEFIGYFGVENEGKYLTTIFIAPEFRNNKKEFLKLIAPYVQDTFESAIYSKNIPCMRFFNKLGKEKSKFIVDGHEATLFTFEKKGLG